MVQSNFNANANFSKRFGKTSPEKIACLFGKIWKCCRFPPNLTVVIWPCLFCPVVQIGDHGTFSVINGIIRLINGIIRLTNSMIRLLNGFIRLLDGLTRLHLLLDACPPVPAGTGGARIEE